MKLDAEEIKHLVARCDQERAEYNRAAEEWERLWKLEPFDDGDSHVSRELDGVERVKLTDPYNIVQLVTRFVASEPRIEIPYISATEDDDERSTQMEEWLTSFWQRASRQQGRNLPADMTWMSAVRGRGAMEVVWVKDVLPKALQEKRLPILPRILDPLNVGVKRGPLYNEYAYHHYDANETYIKQHYPDFDLDGLRGRARVRWKQNFRITSFWYHGNGGDVWHTVTVDDKFAKKPVETDYPDLPIVEWTGDGAPLEDELYRSLSILHPLKDLWPYKCRLASQIGTGLLYYFYPIITALGFTDDFKVGPGETVRVPSADAKLDMLRPDMNVQLAQTMLTMIDTQIQQSTFPAVMYGEEPGQVQAGYGINILAQQARGRVNAIRENQESAIERANEIILALVETFGGKEGVDMWGKSAFEGRGRPINLSGRIIKGNYNNDVRLIPEIPTDETQRITTWLQLVREGIISKGTYRDRIINIPLPRDEDVRVAVEQALITPELANKKSLRAIQRWYKNRSDWELIIQGTPLEQVYQAEQQVLEQQAAEKEAAREERRQRRMMEEAMAANPFIPPNMGGGIPGEMLGQMPPEPSGSMPPGMGMPPGMDMGMQPQGMPGVPAEMAGQLTPEMLGLPPGAPEGMFEQLTGQPVDQAEIERQQMGLPPEGMM